MGEMLKRQFDLLALRLAMDLEGDAPKVSIELQGRDDGELGLVADWVVEAAQIGIPERLDRSGTTYQGMPFDFPAEIVAEIHDVIAQSDYYERPLWLHLKKPIGYLNLVPWEQLLQPVLNMPILRLPDFLANPPRETLHSLEVALCGSVPAAKYPFTAVDELVAMAEQLMATVPRRTTVHIFADAELFDEFNNRVTAAGLGDVHVHDPSGAARFAPAERQYDLAGRTTRVQNPWLLWMRDTLSGRSVDMVHFLTHGYLSRDSGALAFAESPLENRDERIARFVDASETIAFLTQVGAWCVGFSSPENNYSEMGLRLLADTIAQLKPGPVFHHELRLDQDRAALTDAYRFLFARDEVQPPASPALFTYCNPSLLEAAEADPPRRRPRRTRGGQPAAAEPQDMISEVYAEAQSVPSWVGSSQRYIEQRRRDVKRIERSEISSSNTRGRDAQVIEDTLRQIEAKVGRVLASKSDGGE